MVFLRLLVTFIIYLVHHIHFHLSCVPVELWVTSESIWLVLSNSALQLTKKTKHVKYKDLIVLKEKPGSLSVSPPVTEIQSLHNQKN